LSRFGAWQCWYNKNMAVIVPTLDYERRLWAQGVRCVAGVDEAGRGALAGPVVAAAVVLDSQSAGLALWQELRDSKLLAPQRRAELAPQVQAAALTSAVGCVSAGEIDAIGIAAATRRAMKIAIEALEPQPQHLLIDWVRLPLVNIAQFQCAKADQLIVSVAAASILAKVHRDALMVDLHRSYPLYGFAQHKGYGAAAHLAALTANGPCCEHRHSFAPLSARASLFGAAAKS
jgi:ribonuclease HII